MASDYLLLFCDSFYHDNTEDLRVDMVRFSIPVIVKEVRVIPLNCYPHVSLTTPERKGKTQPDDIKLDFFCNEVANPLEPAFNHVGSFEYKDEDIMFGLRMKNACNLLVVRGHYSAITLCLYGVMASPKSSYTFPSTSRSSHSPSPYSDSNSDHEKFRSPDRVGGVDREKGASPDLAGDGKEGADNKAWSSLLDSYNALFEPFSPDHSPEHSFDFYDDEIPSKRQPASSDAGFEEFSDEEIAFGDDDFDVQDTGLDFDVYGEDSWVTSSASFNPFQCELVPLENFPAINVTPHEVLLNKKEKMDHSFKRSHSDEGTRLRDVVHRLKSCNLSVRWLESVEDILQALYPGLALLTNRSSTDGKDVLHYLCNTALTCLDENKIMKMPPPLNVRMLKAGLRLARAIVELGYRALYALLKRGAMESLCGIVCKPSTMMPSSIKLLALRALNVFLLYPRGMERFLGWSKEYLDDTTETSYRRLLDLALSEQTARVQLAVSSLLLKAHVYEVLGTLQKNADQVVALSPVKTPTAPPEDFWNANRPEDAGELTSAASPLRTETKDPDMTTQKEEEDDQKEEKELHQEDEEMDIADPDPAPQLEPMSPDIITSLISSLEELHRVLQKNPLPHTPIFYSLPRVQHLQDDLFPSLTRLFESRRLLECILVLLTVPTLAGEIGLFSAIKDFLILLLNSQDGLLFLMSNPPVTTGIIRALTSMTSNIDNDIPLDAMHPLMDFFQAESSDSCTLANLGILITYHLQILQYIDILRRVPKHTMSDLESNECLGALHTLFSMTLVPIGKCSIAHVLALSDNLTALLPFMEPKGQKEHDNKLSKSSVSSRYSAVLLLLMLQSSANLHLDFLTPHCRRLLPVAEFFKENQSLTMSALYCWLHPLKHLKDPITSVAALMAGIKENVPLVSWSRPTRASAAIVTSLRLVLLRCSPTYHLMTTNNSALAKHRLSLKQKEAVNDLFSARAMDTIICLFQKLSDVLLPLWSQRQLLGVSQASILVLLASLSLRLLRLMLCQLLEDGNHSLRDARLMATIFSLHTSMCSAPHSGILSAATDELQGLIIDCLATFTQSDTSTEEGDECLSPSNNCWCLLLQQLLEYGVSTPRAFLSSIILLSELLPLPLPLHSPKTHTAFDMIAVMRLRQQWAQHLLPVSSYVSTLLEAAIPSSCLVLHQMLRRVCAQLVDLAPSFASYTARLVVEMVLQEIDSDDESGKDSETTASMDEKKESSSCLIRMLTMCAVLSQQAMFKTALVSLISSKNSGQSETNYARFVPLLVFLVQKKETVLPAKLCVMSILHALCNSYVTLQPVNKDMKQPSLEQLANCLPESSQLEHILSAVTTHVTSPDQPLSTIILGLKVISSACQHPPGLVTLHTLLASCVKRFGLLFHRLVASLGEHSPPSAEVLDCVSMLLETIEDLASAGSPAHTLPRELICCAVTATDTGESLLSKLSSALKESCQGDEQLLEEFFQSIHGLETIFDGVSPADVTAGSLTETLPPLLELPEMQPLEQQFLSRMSIFTTSVPTGPEYWQATPPHDEAELEPETVKVDLPALAAQSCPGLQLEEEVKKQLLPSPPSSPKPERKRKIVVSGPEAQKKLRDAIQHRLAMGRGRDMFRARKQNTSRPPSVHVDDFVHLGPAGLTRGRSGLGMSGRGGMGMGGYMMAPPSVLPPPIGNRWMGGVTGGMPQYPRRELPMPPSSLTTWDSRARHFLASVNKPESMRSVWSQVMQDPYRAHNASRTVQMVNYSSRPTSSRLPSRLSSTRRVI